VSHVSGNSTQCNILCVLLLLLLLLCNVRARMRLQVVYVHGDTHEFVLDRPLPISSVTFASGDNDAYNVKQGKTLPNFTRLMTFGDKNDNAWGKLYQLLYCVVMCSIQFNSLQLKGVQWLHACMDLATCNNTSFLRTPLHERTSVTLTTLHTQMFCCLPHTVQLTTTVTHTTVLCTVDESRQSLFAFEPVVVY
jgi:hypothetical protein